VPLFRSSERRLLPPPEVPLLPPPPKQIPARVTRSAFIGVGITAHITASGFAAVVVVALDAAGRDLAEDL